jgi:hypothetical protein
MSILVVQLVREGLLFGADRNVTTQRTLTDGTAQVIVIGQTQRPKVLQWPNRDVLLGYVGEGTIGGKSTDRWLYSFMGQHLDFPTLKDLAEDLRIELDGLFQAGDFKQPLIVHLGGFEEIGNEWRPEIYFIRNTVALTPEGAYTIGTRFDCSEEVSTPDRFVGKTAEEIRDYVTTTLFSFRQGIDLASFGSIDQALREAMRAIVHGHPNQPHGVPTTLDEWAKHVAFSIHGYGAYFAAFHPPYEQLVGGGADVVTAPWPPK